MLVVDNNVSAVITYINITCVSISLINNTAITLQAAQLAVADIIPLSLAAVQMQINVISVSITGPDTHISINIDYCVTDSTYITCKLAICGTQSDIYAAAGRCQNVAGNIGKDASCRIIIGINADFTFIVCSYITFNSAAGKLNAACICFHCIATAYGDICQTICFNTAACAISNKRTVCSYNACIMQDDFAAVFCQ